MKKYKIFLMDENEIRELTDNEEIENLKIICGRNTKDNIIKIHKSCKFSEGCCIRFNGVGTEIILNANRHIFNFNVFTCEGSGLKLNIGKNVSMRNNIEFMLGDEGAAIILGNDCMLSKDITFLGGAGHAVISVATQKVVNGKKSITIGDKVWIDQGAIIYPGVSIGDNSFISAHAAVYSGKYGDNLELGGNPAIILNRNIFWKKEFPTAYVYEKKEELKKIISIIPARYQSSRFPGKPLANILGKPMIQWVYEKVASIQEIADVYVATDDERIYNAVLNFGGKAIMTGECSCGSDRVYQACKNIDADIILNIQGDEPAIKVQMIRNLVQAFDDSSVQMATLKTEIESEEDIDNPNIVKVITDVNNDALYFSRSAIPYNRDKVKNVKYYKHIGVYGYTKQFLQEYVNMSQSIFEKVESLEQLRVLENGHKIRVIETKFQSIGVDLPEHINLVEEELKREGLY